MIIFFEKAKSFVLEEQKRTSMPLLQHIELSSNVGAKLAKELGANVQIVETGTYLMDCMIGEALEQGRLPEHIKMSVEKADELMKNSSLSDKDKENIRHCVLEHHGVKKFYSLESEICCNADCYRFISIKGFSYAMRYLRDMSLNDLIILLENKTQEKWGALTLKVCKDELEPQYKLIIKLLAELKG
jgi:hypothetical protein